QKHALEELLFELMKEYEIPLSQIERHKDHDLELSCPGGNFSYFELLHSMAIKILRANRQPLLEEIIAEKGLKLPLEDAQLVVYKSRYRMDLYSGKILLKSYKIGLSNKPAGDKLKEGDRRTPVGEYYICEKYPMRAWMEINYPNKQNAEKGLKNKVIDKEQYRKIVYFAGMGGIPWHDSDMGNDIGLHAGGFDYGRMRKDYTAGCVGLEDAEAYEIHRIILPGTRVLIKE
ncbi:MAG: murein L,D-transpeptidase family protein, partial [Vulcanimicrobiota bacterium]